MESPIYSLSGYPASPSDADSTSHQRIKFLYDGSKLVEKLVVVCERYLKQFNSDYVYPNSYCLGVPLMVTCPKAKHYARYFFQKFYSKLDWQKFNYVDIAMACCYLALKVQDSVMWQILPVDLFLKVTHPIWESECDRSVETMKYLLPRVECIVLGGIGFDLALNIPHNYVQLCCREAFGMKTKDVDDVVHNPCNLSYFIRFFLDIALNSSLCVSYSPRVLGAAAVRYAIGKFPADRLPPCNAAWLDRLGMSDAEVREILQRRHDISTIVEAMQRLQGSQTSQGGQGVQGVHRSHKRSASASASLSAEESGKRQRTPLAESPTSSHSASNSASNSDSSDESRRERGHRRSVTALSSHPTPISLPEPEPEPEPKNKPEQELKQEVEPEPLIDTNSQTQTPSKPYLQSQSQSQSQIQSQPLPLMDVESQLGLQPEPLVPIPAQAEPLVSAASQPEPLIPSPPRSVEPEPLMTSQGIAMEEEPAPFLPGMAARTDRREEPFWTARHGRMFGKPSQGNTKKELIVTAI